MNKESFWIFTHLGNGDAIVCNALFRHYAELHKDKLVILPIWEHNLAAIQWLLSDVPNIFFYPIETEQQLLTCRDSLGRQDMLRLGFYGMQDGYGFNPVLWDSEFYRQAGIDPELKWKGFKLPEFYTDNSKLRRPFNVMHHDPKRGFEIKLHLIPNTSQDLGAYPTLKQSVEAIYSCDEIHCIDSSMLNLADLMETPYCKRFVFHRYARRGLPPTLRKAWEILD